MHARVVIPLIFVSIAAWGQSVISLPGPPPFAMPGWLAPFPQARDQSAGATTTDASSTYTAPAPAAAVIAHYEKEMRAAGVSFQTRQDGSAARIEVTAEKAQGTIRIRDENGVTKVDVNYGLRREPPPGERALSPLRMEWPAWLELPGGRVVSQRSSPRGRIATWSVETCPGDVIGKPSQGCLKRVYESPRSLMDAYGYFESLLEQHGYSTEIPGQQARPDSPLSKSIADDVASLTLREYPAPEHDDYYRQIDVFIRPSQAKTRVEITFQVNNGAGAEAKSDVSARAR